MKGADARPAASEVARNLRLYPWYVGLRDAYFWMPLFFLYFASLVPLRELLWLEAIYYGSVVALEVPSGYLSDRLGRRPTLLLAATARASACLLFASAQGFWTLAAAQALLGVAMACDSGTDTSLHLDTLEACERGAEYRPREARVSRVAFWSYAGAALVGGAVGVASLRAAYGLAATSALLSLGVAWLMVEPPRRADEGAPAIGVQLARCLTRARQAPLGWLFAVGVAATVTNHIPYELYQPYLALVAADQTQPWLVASTPLLAGLHMTLASLLAGWVGGHSATLAARWGTRRVLLAGLTLQGLVIASMALWIHPLIVALIAARSVPSALQTAPMNAAVAPRLTRSMRATYLSLQSLAGRLAYGLVLLGLSAIVLTPDASEAALRRMLVVGGALTALIVMGLSAWRVAPVEPG